jgi:hypothetical protein
MLKILGHREGVKFLNNTPNPLLSLPYYLPRFEKLAVKYLDATQIYCRILKRLHRRDHSTDLMPIEETPQFSCLKGNQAVYQEYVSEFLGRQLKCDYSVEKLMALSQSLAYLEEPYATSYILVKEFKPDKYVILDGVHRASVLKYKGIDRFPVAIML